MLDIEFNKSEEFKRLYHGRGLKDFFTIDSIGNTLLIEIFEDKELDIDLSKVVHENIILKKRFSNEVIALKGEIPKELYAIENGLKFKLNLFNQNIGFFGDIKPAREYIKNISKDKNVLNLFSYTCAFSVYARAGEAKRIVNIDLSKSALKVGQANHQINNLSTKNISFLSYNVLYSFNRLKDKFDVVIIDPPTFQKGSFDIKKDYFKIASKLTKILNEKAIIVATVNSPFLDKEFLKEVFKEFSLIDEIEPNPDYTNSSLKVLVFQN